MNKALRKLNNAINDALDDYKVSRIAVSQRGPATTTTIRYFNDYPEKGNPRNVTEVVEWKGIGKIQYLAQFNKSVAKILRSDSGIDKITLDVDGYVISHDSKRLSEGAYMSTGKKYHKE